MSDPVRGQHVRRFLFFPLLFVALWCLAAPARADETLSSAAEDSVPSRQLKKELAILQADPEQASESCVTALKELKETQAKIAAAEDKTTSIDLTVAKDVLESNYESAIEMCGPDARRLCAAPEHREALSKVCRQMSDGEEE